DYAHWQRNWLQGEELARQLAYWQGQLKGLPTVHQLPLDHTRSVNMSNQGAIHRTQIEQQDLQTLNAVCQRQGATLFMGLHAAFSVLLSRYSNETDIVVGSPIANREQAEIADLIGFFVNTLVLRSDLSENPSFETLLQQSKEMLLGAFAHQQVPFEHLVEKLQPERGLNHSPLFQVMLVLQNNEPVDLSLPGLSLSQIENKQTAAKFDLTLTVVEQNEKLALSWEYNSSLFNATTIERMSAHFGLLLKALLHAPNEKVLEVPMLSNTEQYHLLEELNNAHFEYDKQKCVHELFEQHAKANPASVALEYGEASMTYEALNCRANQLAHYLINEHGVVPDTCVGICMSRSLEMVIAILGILKAGGAYVPLDPTYPEQRLAYILDDAQPTAVAVDSAGKSALGNVYSGNCFDLLELSSRVLSDYNTSDIQKDTLGLRSHHLAYIIYTSGSTGKPKGVMVKHRNLTALTNEMENWFEDDARMGWCANYVFDASLQGVSYLISGHPMVVIPEDIKVEPALLKQYIEKHRIDILDCTPSLLEFWLESGINLELPHLLVGGEAISAKLWSVLSERAKSGKLTYNVYGPTECTVNSTVAKVEGTQVHIGSALPYASTYVLSVNGTSLVPKGCVGELCIGGDGVTRGYLNRPELTETCFIENPFYSLEQAHGSPRLYRTGDLVRYLEDGNLEFIGRVDDQVKIRGFRVETGEIAAGLQDLPCVDSALVMTAEVADSLQLVAYVKANEEVADAQLFINKIKRALGERLPDYMVPSLVQLVSVWPLTANGKIDKKALPSPSCDMSGEAFVAPNGEVEEMLAEIWSDLLGVQVDKISATANFFDLGGHS
ncbi:hypothetical protein N480_25750, partial [Pseudoalteromonas luteoviolacea S2607]|uniref:non-ribosomal peptide synthetase n=1 Tax=Pseudoalteromonas luteoviolacea TaxID=43657 RepID=UPI0007B164FD